MRLAGLCRQEEAGTLDNNVHIHFIPLQVRRVTFCCQADFLTIDYQIVALHSDITVETAMHRIVFQHVCQVIGFQQVVDCDDFDFREIFRCCTEHHTTDTTKSIDTNTNCHFLFSL